MLRKLPTIFSTLKICPYCPDNYLPCYSAYSFYYHSYLSEQPGKSPIDLQLSQIFCGARVLWTRVLQHGFDDEGIVPLLMYATAA